MSTLPPIYVAVIDDDESLGRSLARLLRASGMQPITYVSAEAFLADTKQPRFDCLVLDVHLGGMSGASARSALLQRIGAHRVTISPQPDSATPGNFVVQGVWAYNERNLAALDQCLKREREICRDCEVSAGREEAARPSLRSRLRRLLSPGEDL